jgi:hypothetical protein
MPLLQASASGAVASCAGGPRLATGSPTVGMGPRVLDSSWRRWRLSTACLPHLPSGAWAEVLGLRQRLGFVYLCYYFMCSSI